MENERREKRLVTSVQRCGLCVVKFFSRYTSATLAIFFNIVTSPASQPNPTLPVETSLQVYAVQIMNSIPLKTHLSGNGVYLGNGLVLTAAHVVGRWTLLENPQVKTAHERVTAQIIKKGSFSNLDLALLRVDEQAVPDLQLRINPLCKSPAPIGARVVVAYPDRLISSRIASPGLIPPAYRANFGTLILEPQGSGSGVYDPERNCLLGIMSAAITTFRPGSASSRIGYFVPSRKIAPFIQNAYRP
jgi:S1-C subfamily serine protease